MNEQTEKLREKMVKIQETYNVEPGEMYHAQYWKEHRGFIGDQILKEMKEAGLKFVETGENVDFLEYWDFGMKIREIDIE